jgi:hypothetical protein
LKAEPGQTAKLVSSSEHQKPGTGTGTLANEGIIAPDEHRQEPRQSRTKARSEYSSHLGEGSSVRDGSPSPPALTDGASRADTPSSEHHRPMLSSSYLSESNHRLSHVAETGQLQPRSRMSRKGDSIVIPALDPQTYKSTFSFAGGQSGPLRSPLAFSPHLLGPPSPKGSQYSDSAVPVLHAPQPVFVSRKTSFDLRSYPPDMAPSDNQWPRPHIRSSSGNILLAGHHPSPILSEYMSEAYHENTEVINREQRGRHQAHQSDGVLSQYPTSVNTPEAAAYGSDFRKVNSNFEVRRNGTMGPMAVPLELAPLPLGDLKPTRTSKEEKRQSRRLQKKRRSKSLGG